MTNPRIEKVKLEISKMKTRILDYQARLRALERQKIELENEEIVAFVRGEMIGDAELGALMKSIRGGDGAESVGVAEMEVIATTKRNTTKSDESEEM